MISNQDGLFSFTIKRICFMKLIKNIVSRKNKFHTFENWKHLSLSSLGQCAEMDMIAQSAFAHTRLGAIYFASSLFYQRSWRLNSLTNQWVRESLLNHSHICVEKSTSWKFKVSLRVPNDHISDDDMRRGGRAVMGVSLDVLANNLLIVWEIAEIGVLVKLNSLLGL